MSAAVLSLAAALLAAPSTPPAPSIPDLPWWPRTQRAAQRDYEKALNDVPRPQRLRQWHDRFGSEPHVAGTPGDLRNIDRLAAAFEELGLDVQRHDFWTYLARPVDAAVEIVSPVSLALPLREDVLAEDPSTGHPDLDIGWNAYSGSGDVTGGVVYANYGTREDFEKLRELGVRVAGRIVVARYGGNFRGYKAKFTEAAGAAGLIIYTDPEDSGYGKGIPYPEGGWANDTSVQRGSIKTLPWPGDPLTPFEPADDDAARLDPAVIALPRIPVQPVGWRAAAEILSRMRGPGVPEGWQGGLPFAYRTTGGADLRVRLMVRQKRSLERSSNVIGVLSGSSDPQQKVIIGCHHDAWGFGAGDPLAGTIVLYECARSFAELARRGTTPARTIVFAAWGAEEYGIIGSVEWCEARRDELLADAVAYVNLDAAAMGPVFGCSASPSLKRLVMSAAASVPQAGAAEPRSVLEAWTAGADPDPAAPALPSFGDLGGGSDHIGFYCHLGVPACGLSGKGGGGTAYHSNYDTLAWYRKAVGDDYGPALMLTRVANLIVARLAGAPLLPLDPLQYAPDLRGHLADLKKRAEALEVAIDVAPLHQAVNDYEGVAGPVYRRLLEAADEGRLDRPSLGRINGILLAMERSWLHEPGLPGRPWFRSLYAATDPHSGYAAWMLPGLRHHVEHGDPEGFADARRLYVDALAEMVQSIREIDAALGR